jgi:hypothetical protein
VHFYHGKLSGTGCRVAAVVPDVLSSCPVAQQAEVGFANGTRRAAPFTHYTRVLQNHRILIGMDLLTRLQNTVWTANHDCYLPGLSEMGC